MAKKTSVHIEPATLHQVAALPLRVREGVIEVCLVTTRETRRWTIPKGWPMKGRDDPMAARIEAEQEAGVSGRPCSKSVGTYVYWKRRAAHFDLIEVTVFPLHVTKTLTSWKEQTEREVQWTDLESAALVVDEPGLAALLLNMHADARLSKAIGAKGR